MLTIKMRCRPPWDPVDENTALPGAKAILSRCVRAGLFGNLEGVYP